MIFDEEYGKMNQSERFQAVFRREKPDRKLYSISVTGLKPQNDGKEKD